MYFLLYAKIGTATLSRSESTTRTSSYTSDREHSEISCISLGRCDSDSGKENIHGKRYTDSLAGFSPGSHLTFHPIYSVLNLLTPSRTTLKRLSPIARPGDTHPTIGLGQATRP